ncbi:MAG: hypothetical protein ACRYFX_00295 [Janthinobacterium lividum]
MGYTYYSYLAFITPDSAADLAGLQACLQALSAQLNQAPKPTLTLDGNELTVAFEEYSFHIYYATEAHVQEEALEIAATNPDTLVDLAEQPIDPARLGTCTRRFELWGDPDPDMDYFNDSLYILEALEELEGVIIPQLD